MSGRKSRAKGARAEREVADIFGRYGFASRRTPNSGGLAIRGDLTNREGGPCIPGYSIEVKRCESILMPKWLRQSYADAGVNTPTVVFRRSRSGNDPLGFWHITVPLDSWLTDQAELRQLRRERAA